MVALSHLQLPTCPHLSPHPPPACPPSIDSIHDNTGNINALFIQYTYLAWLYHTMHSIIQISNTQNTKSLDMIGFPRPGHKCKC